MHCSLTSPRRQNEWEGRRGGTRGRRLWWLVATHFQCAVFESLPRPLGAGPGLVPPGRLIGVPPTANCAGGKAFPLNCHTFCRRFECNLVTPREAGTGHKRGLTPERLRSWRQCPFSGGSDRAGACRILVQSRGPVRSQATGPRCTRREIRTPATVATLAALGEPPLNAQWSRATA